ncbi:hypothetical protein A1O7_07863 [Cladophialophora yegresii CBS 114405]|uniref:Uncharacterized protein n=1 Tax=Cladophialophora yegresii CBS 114405 TaxID=1182544 RepID=W9VXT2_9EURO|nr:uncharacterized protein A1O7_07863 [Cladophialophora yegresii CBS 114405]EXJ57515.1 hypothetical protein A1O7_07863 [Cladophialophora yegresii CBS 114405]
MEDHFVTDNAADPRATHDGQAHLNPADFQLLSPGEAMLPQSNTWEQALHNLRYGLDQHNKPEDTMTYEGPAHSKIEVDWVMRQHYHRYIHESRRREYLKRKLEEKRVELEETGCEPEYPETERRRQQAERVAVSDGSRQEAVFGRLQGQKAAFNARHLQNRSAAPAPAPESDQYPALYIPATIANVARQDLTQQPVSARTRRAVLNSTSGPVAGAATRIQTQNLGPADGLCNDHDTSFVRNGAAGSESPTRGMHFLDESITTSPTYRYAPAPSYRLATGNDIDDRLGIAGSHAEPTARLSGRPRVDWYKQYLLATNKNIQTSSSHGKIENGFPTSRQQSFPQAQQSYLASAAAYTPADSADLPYFDMEMYERTCAAPQQTTTAMMGTTSAEATPPLSSDASAEGDMILDDSEVTADDVEPQSSNLSDIIGSETPSEDDGEDDDDDEEFDPNRRGTGLKVPKHQEVRGFGMRRRRSSGRAGP